ncbi:MAG: helix-turn-helix domain-containing protein [Kiritimatiellia bacterium]
MSNTTSTNFIPSVEKAIGIMNCLGEEKASPLTTSVLANRVGASVSTCYRILKTLESAGWVRGDRENGYRVSTGLLRVLGPLNVIREIATLAGPILNALSARTGMTAKLSVRQGRDQVTIAAGQPRVPLAVLAPVGVPYPVVQAASGAVLVAHLKDAEINKMIDHTSAADWGHDAPENLWQRIAQCRETGVVENIGHHPMGLDAIACAIEHPRERLALTLIGLHGEMNNAQRPLLRKDLCAVRDELLVLLM